MCVRGLVPAYDNLIVAIMTSRWAAVIVGYVSGAPLLTKSRLHFFLTVKYEPTVEYI